MRLFPRRFFRLFRFFGLGFLALRALTRRHREPSVDRGLALELPKVDRAACPGPGYCGALDRAWASSAVACSIFFFDLRTFGRRFLSIRLSPSLSVSFARHGQSFLARGLLSNHRRFKRLHERDGANRCCFTMQIDEIAQMKKARDAVPVALLSRLGEIDIDPFVWLKKRKTGKTAREKKAQRAVWANAPLIRG